MVVSLQFYYFPPKLFCFILDKENAEYFGPLSFGITTFKGPMTLDPHLIFRELFRNRFHERLHYWNYFEVIE
jgi:hypothetical protein